MVKLVNRAKMTISSTGTGTITLAAADTGFQTFADAGVSDGDLVRYTIEDGDNFELGAGIYTASGTTLSRTVAESNNGGAAITCTADAKVFVTATEADMRPAFSTTAPANPHSGNEWVDTATFKKYVYYDDGSSAQWVQV